MDINKKIESLIASKKVYEEAVEESTNDYEQALAEQSLKDDELFALERKIRQLQKERERVLEENGVLWLRAAEKIEKTHSLKSQVSEIEKEIDSWANKLLNAEAQTRVIWELTPDGTMKKTTEVVYVPKKEIVALDEEEETAVDEFADNYEMHVDDPDYEVSRKKRKIKTPVRRVTKKVKDLNL
jgi:chromosome segregation ATPase